MGVDFVAQPNSHGQSIDLRWNLTTTEMVAPQWHLVRKKRAYPVNKNDGSRVLNSSDFSEAGQFLQPPSSKITAQITISQNADSGERTYAYSVTDANELTTENIYYYTLLDDSEHILGHAVATANKSYGFADKLYQLLPAVYRSYDEASPSERGQGELRHFLEIFGLMLDQVRSSAEGLRDRHNILETRADFLPHLAQWIGWDLDVSRDEISQRNEILRAPELYRTVGTLPNLAALVNRATGWKCRIKEYAQNVCLSNAPEILHLWEIWKTQYDIATQSWQEPTPVTQTDSFDGRPFRLQDGAGVNWLFWHSNRRGRRELWRQRLNDVTAPNEPIKICPQDNPDQPLEIAESFAALADGTDLWIFFDAGQPGQRDIWSVNLASRPSNSGVYLASALPNQTADDSYPAAISLRGQIRLFWQSNRLGQFDIWTCSYDDDDGKKKWSRPPTRVTKDGGRNEKPAVIVDGQGVIWVFYCHSGLDTHCCLYYVNSRDGQNWSDPVKITDGPFDDLPTAVVREENQIWLLWQAKGQTDNYQLWAKTYNTNGWNGQFKVTNHPAADKEPAAIVDSTNQVHVYFRSQRRGYPYLSRTLDTANAEMMSFRKTPKDFENRIHYTYDTGLDDEKNWCARNTIGVYLTPVTSDAKLSEQGRSSAEELLRRFLPIQVRVIFVIEPPVYREMVYTYDFPDEQPQRLIEEQFSDPLHMVERYDGMQENYTDIVSNWIWLYAWDKAHNDHKTVDFSTNPPSTAYRTWQEGISNKLDDTQ